MVTNLPPRCMPYWNRYEEAKSIKEKIAAIEELIACIPKHKGTEKLLKDLKMKLAKLRAELLKETERKQKTKPVFSVSKKGDAQVVLIGTPSSGKTSLLNAICNASYPVGVPTQRPQEGIFKWEGCKFQIVDLPPILCHDINRTPNGRAIAGIAYNADLIGLVIDTSQSVDWQLDVLVTALSDANIALRSPPPVRIRRTKRGGIIVLGSDFSPFSVEELKEILASYRIHNCVLEFYGRTSEYDLSLALNPRIVFKKAIIIATKLDMAQDKEAVINRIKLWLKNAHIEAHVVPFSIYHRECVDVLGRAIFESLNLIRVWTKSNGIVRRDRAIVLRSPATIKDVCERIHSIFVKRFRYAVIEREGDRIRRRHVGLDYEVKDGDIVTIYLRD
mgnify:CR=1 FL=1